MPEGVEICILSQYLKSKLKGRNIDKITVLSGKYTRTPIKGIDEFKKSTILDIKSKGKMLYFILSNDTYITMSFGLSGWLYFHKDDNSRIKMSISNNYNNNKYKLYYDDPMNFGNMAIYHSKKEFDKILDGLAPDFLQTDFDHNIFKPYLSKPAILGNILVDQHKIGSGIGNYLLAEILYDAKLSPHRKMNSLTITELKQLTKSIKYIMKLSYYNNPTEYIADDYIANHKKCIDNSNPLCPDFHSNIVLDKNAKFVYNVYGKEYDNLGNKVIKDKTVNKGKTVHWIKW